MLKQNPPLKTYTQAIGNISNLDIEFYEMPLRKSENIACVILDL